MGKTLKVCLAMGGGVSLGSFSGAALTEALKLLILYGQDKDGKPYDRVILDGMSGASAGAIALTIMLKTLVDYKAMMAIYNTKVATYEGKSREEMIEETGTTSKDEKTNEPELVKELADSYFNGDTDTAEKHKNIEELKALQLAQKVQRQIWTKQLTVKKLYGEKLDNYDINPHDSFGLLHRKVLIDSAQFYLIDDIDFDLGNAKVLDENRVVFACSLTNLVPIELEEKQNGKTPILRQNAYKSTGSQNHAELRVFDFVFKEDQKKPSDNRWFQITDKGLIDPNRNPKMSLGFKDKETWAILSSSALACGAFPFAFEPVVLKRYKQEYQGYWPSVFNKMCQEIKDLPKKESFFNEKDRADNYEPITYDSFNFPYIDGGTFNNEPIREAFRIGSFQDFKRVDKKEDRLVLFVDPAVRQEKYSSFNIPSYQVVGTDPKLRTTALKTELSKMSGNVGSTIGLLANQGSIKEEHRIKDAEQSLKLREELFTFIHENDLIHQKITIKLIARAFDKIQANLEQGAISLGTRDVIEYFQNELNKVCHERHEKVEDCHTFSDATLRKIESKIIADQKNTISGIQKTPLDIKELFEMLNEGYDEIEDTNDIEERKVLFAQTIFRVLTDFSLGTVGKNGQSEYMAILPISEDLQTIELPGDEVEAFGGFASYPSRDYAFEYGRFSTLLSLKQQDGGFRQPPGHSSVKNHPIIADKNLETIQENMKKDISKLEFYQKEYSYVEDIKSLYYLSIKRLSGLLRRPKGNTPFSFRKVLRGIKTGLFGGIASVAFLPPLRRNALPALFKTKTNKLAEDIKFKTLPSITVSIITNQKLSGKVEVDFLEPGTKSKSLKIVRIQPEKGKRRYQYLFQLHYLEYINWKNYSTSLSKIQSLGNVSKGANLKGESIAYSKIDSENVDTIGLALSKRVENPSIDSNIEYRNWRKEFEKNSRKIEIKGLTISEQSLGNLQKELNDKNSSLHYSLKNLNYHVNPMLEFDMGNKEMGWYFKENTQAFYFNLLPN